MGHVNDGPWRIVGHVNGVFLTFIRVVYGRRIYMSVPL